MKIKYSIDEKYTAPEIVICNNELNEATKQLAETIKRAVNRTLVGYNDRENVIISMGDIIRIYAEKQHVIVDTINGTYLLRHKLYELEEMFVNTEIIRISKSELVNIKHIDSFDTSLAGTIGINLHGNIKSFVSRRNVVAIKARIVQQGDNL